MQLIQRTSPTLLGLLLIGTATACSGGGGGGNSGATHSTGLGALTRTGQLGAVSTTDARVELCTGLEIAGLGGTIALALDGRRDRFYTHDFGREALVRIDSDGSSRLIRSSPTPPDTLTFDRRNGQLFGIRTVNATRGELSSIDPETGANTVIGLSARVRCLAFDDSDGSLFGVGNASSAGVLYSIDSNTGVSTELATVPLLASVFGLAFDPVTRTLYGFEPATGRLVSIDLASYVVTELAVFDSSTDINDIAFDVDSGTLYGLTQGGEIVELTGSWPAGELRQRTVLDRFIGSLTWNETEQLYYGVDAFQQELVSFDPSSSAYRTIGSLAGYDIDSLVYDPALGTLYGIDVRASGIDPLVQIDTTDATVTFIPGAEFLYPTQLAIDTTTGDIWGYERNRNLSLSVDPTAPAPADRISIRQASVMNTAGGRSYILDDLTWDPVERRILGVGTLRIDEGGGSSSFYDVLISFVPTQAGSDRVLLQDVLGGSAITQGQVEGEFHVTGRNQPLIEVSFDRASGRVSTIDGLWNLSYVAAVYAPGRDVIFATDAEFVYSIDPQTGATAWIDNQPVGVRADDLLYDATLDRLGLRDGGTITWVNPDSPRNGITQTTVPPYRVIVGDPLDPQTLYGLSSGFLYRIDVATGATTQLNMTPLPGVREETGALGAGSQTIFVHSDDQRLFEVDTVTGTWRDAGPLEFSARALYAN